MVRINQTAKPLSRARLGVMVCMLLSFAARLWHYWGFWGDGYPLWIWGAQIVLPLLACLGFAASMLAPGRLGIHLSILPALMGVTFFMAKASFFTTWHMLVCHTLYTLVGGLYCFTIMGMVRSVRWLQLSVALPLAFHVVMDVVRLVRDGMNFFAFLSELSVLLIMAGLLFASVAIAQMPPHPEDVE